MGNNIQNLIRQHNQSLMEKHQQPQQKNAEERIEVEVIGIGSKGDDIAKHQGRTVIVPETKMGDKVRVVITNEYKNILFAKKASGS